MVEWTSILPLAAQAMFAVLMVEQLRRKVFISIDDRAVSALMTDVWAPVAIVLPMMFFTARIHGDVAGAGWMPIGGPVVAAVLALGLALCTAARSEPTHRAAGPVTSIQFLIWGSVGVVLLLLGAAHDLTMWMGQCAFAIVAVLLWMNTPDASHAEQLTPTQLRAGWGMTMALLCALAQGMATLYVPSAHLNVSCGLVLGGVAMSLAAAARLAGADAVMRIGGWAMTYGFLAGLGAISLVRLTPQVIRAIQSGSADPVHRIAYGFGAYSIEAIAAIAVAGGAAFLMRWRGRAALVIGLAVIIAAACLAAWRIHNL